jgi:hypothetical protein
MPIRVLRLVLAALAAAAATSTLAQAPPFSADLVMTMTGEAAEQLKALAKQTGQPMPTSQTGRLAISGMKMRWEMSAGLQPVVLVSDMTKDGRSYMLHPARKTYTELPRSTEGERDREDSGDLARFLAGGGDVCQMSKDHASCRKLGVEKVSGRSCQEYELVRSSGEKERLCVDEKLHYPLRVVGPQATTVLQNVVEGPQPASLFAIPPGYAKQGG